MSKDLAVNKKADIKKKTLLFDQIAPALSAVEPEIFIDKKNLLRRFEELKAQFERDYERINDVSGLLYGEDITAYGERATSVFMRWEEEGGGPALTAIVVSALEHAGLSGSSVAKAAFMAAVLAEVPNMLQYHGNEHYRKVLFHAIRLMATHNNIFAGTKRELTENQMAILLIASCIHDLGHEGGDNLRDGVYTPGYMEQRALDIARPYLAAAGLPDDMMGEIETLVFCTDITFFAGENSPCIRLKKIYKHYFWDDQSDDVSMMMMGKLRRYEENPDLVEMAMLLHEADIGSSAGLSYEQTIRETINIMEERGLKTAGPRTVLNFLKEQLGETMFTEAGKQLFGPVMAIVIDQAEREIRAGRQTYYE